MSVPRLGPVHAAALALAIAACGPRGHAVPPASHGGADTEVTLYRDHAVVVHRVKVTVPAAAPATIRLRVAAGVEPESIYVAEKGELTIREVKLVGGTPAPAAPLDAQPDAPPAPYPAGGIDAAVDLGGWDVDEDEVPEPDDAEPEKLVPVAALLPTEVELVIGGPREGSFTIVLGYDTERITWDAGYTMTTTAARDRATLRGALAIRNATGLPLPRANVWVVDAEHGPATLRIAERNGPKLVGRDGNISPLAEPLHLGVVDVVEGDTRIELLAGAPAQPMKSVLVYDPIGTVLDHPGVAPLRDASLGLSQSMSSKVTESFEVERDLRRTSGMPAGKVRLLERRTDGSLGVLGEARIFEAAARIAHVDTIAIGTADGVAGRRERRELTIDDDRKRLSEEFAITIENKRDHPIEVVLREHFYRGQNWALAYQSIPLASAAKEGAQQVVMRIAVPPRAGLQPGKMTVLYVAVYTW